MSLFSALDGPSVADRICFMVGERLVKAAADAEVAYCLKGMLYLSQTGYVLLSVANAFVRGIFANMHEPGISLPPSPHGQGLDAHITVFRPEEVKEIGGPDKITERGKQFAYTLGRLKTMEPGENWPGVERVWFCHVHSPELQELRRSYGLDGFPDKGQKPFHVTVAVRRRGVLARNDKSKVP